MQINPTRKARFDSQQGRDESFEPGLTGMLHDVLLSGFVVAMDVL
jgi:hypothetical protein